MRRPTPCGSIGDAANTGSPATPSAKYRHWLVMPRREPSAMAPSRTIIGWNVNGTGVNGSGTLICAAAAVSAATNATAPARSATRNPSDSARVVTTASKVVGGIDTGSYTYAFRTDNRRRSEEHTSELQSHSFIG